jgi:lipid II:glycine glycyltransferase (peptidoglycan interpeptide bridge formation enzyme)
MKACVLDEAQTAEWDELVANEGAFSLMQSWRWGVFKERLGWKAFRVVVEDAGIPLAGAQLLIRPLPLGRSVAYVPRGPVGRWLEDEMAPILFSELDRIARANRAIFLKIEPAVQDDPATRGVLERHGFQQSGITNQPQTTILLDITHPQDEILMRMKKRARRYVRHSEREGITIREGGAEDLPAFYELMRVTAERAGFVSRSLQYYRAEWDTCYADGSSVLHLAYHQDRLIAARTVNTFGRHAAEFAGGSVPIHGLHPNYLLVWRGIQWAQQHGCATYDMWGIPDEVDPAAENEQPQAPETDKGLWGVYQFKRGFSSNVVRYVGAYDRVFMPSLYSLFESTVRSRRSWERAATWLDMTSRLPTSSERAPR